MTIKLNFYTSEYSAMAALLEMREALNEHVWEVYDKYTELMGIDPLIYNYWEISASDNDVEFLEHYGRDGRTLDIPMEMFTDPTAMQNLRDNVRRETEADEIIREVCHESIRRILTTKSVDNSEDEKNAGYWWTPA